MNQMFLGFGAALAFGITSGGALWWLEPADIFLRYTDAFFVSFNCLISGGLIIGTAMIVFWSQDDVPSFIERTFDSRSLHGTSYYEQKIKYLSLRRSLIFSTDFIIVGFVIFYFCKFPFNGYPEYILISFGCLEYALGVYVGRKLFYIVQMLNAVQDIKVTGSVFKDDELGYVNNYVNVLSTLTIIFVYVHVTSYYNAPFEFSSAFGRSFHIALLLPAVIATPVLLLFNFYPRTVLRALYSRSINEEVTLLTDRLKRQAMTDFERWSCVLEYDKLWKEELRNRLRITMSDLPIGITIIIMIGDLLLRK